MNFMNIRFLKYFLGALPFFYLLFFQTNVDHLSLGDGYLKEGKISFAREEYKKAHSINKTADHIIRDRLEKLEFMNREDQIHLNAALEFDRNGKFDEASAEYEKALRINPRSLKALEGLMVNLFRAGENEKGLAAIKKMNDLSVENPSTLFHKALYDYRKSNFERCAATLVKCMKMDKNDAQVKELHAMCSAKISEIKEKKNIYARELFIKGARYLKARDFKMAALSFQDSLMNKVPEETGAVPGEVLDKKIPVIEVYSKAGIYFNLSTAFEMSGKFEDAISALEKINDFKPDIDTVNYKIAENYSRAGNDAEAYKYYSTVNRLNVSFPNIYNKLAFCAKKIGDYEQSISFFRRAIEYDPKNPINYYNLAIMYKKSEKYLDSYEVFQKTLGMLSRADNSLKYLINEQLGQLNAKINGVNAKKQ
jgi:tetratricopeptide (TPR) repeat protein